MRLEAAGVERIVCCPMITLATCDEKKENDKYGEYVVVNIKFALTVTDKVLHTPFYAEIRSVSISLHFFQGVSIVHWIYRLP